jgi:hypothetical protein
MAGFFLKGALVEYGTKLLGPLPNIVVFQFNPEEISRNFTLATPRASTSTMVGETSKNRPDASQAAAPPTETLQLTIHLSAADDLGDGGALSIIPRGFGIGPQLAALEKMVYPTAGLAALFGGASLDAVASALTRPDASRRVPREQVPRILFIWGPNRVLPVEIQSLSMTEQKFDSLLNPVQAQVQLGLSIASFPDKTTDQLGKGALTYTQLNKEAQAALNLVKAAQLAVEIIPF